MTRLKAAFQEQAKACIGLGSPFMGRLMDLLAAHWPDATGLARLFAAWPGPVDSGGAALALRLAGGLHVLVSMGRDPRLAAAYPPHGVDDPTLLAAVLGALHREDAFLSDWVQSPPQTNEVRRSAVLIAATHWLDAQFHLPFQLSELGASAGLNLMFDRYGMDICDQRWGPEAAAVCLAPDWRGPLPPRANPQIAERRGVDLNPLQIGNAADELRLLAYLWPDQSERMARTRAAMALADAPVDRGDAITWLAGRLATPWPGRLHLIYHTIAWQYFSADAQDRGRALIRAAGAAATPATPLAWLGMEADADPDSAGLTLQLWPGNLTLHLGRAGFHAQWVEWTDGVG